jgi:hypothetical protein
MGHFKTFVLGMLVAYGVYYVTRKGQDGKSILDDLLDHPDIYLKRAKEGLLEDTARTVKEIVK